MSKTNTANDIFEWLSTQLRPRPPKRTFLLVRDTTSEAMEAFTVQYNRLVRENVSSRTVQALRMAAVRAEKAKDLANRLPPNVRGSQSVQDALSHLQNAVLDAANWVRRFADDRHRKGEWIIVEEQKTGKDIAAKIESKVKELFVKIGEKTTSKAIQEAFQVWEIKWKKDEASELKEAERLNAVNITRLKKQFAKVQKEDVSNVSDAKKFLYIAYIAELEDSRKELNEEEKKVVEEVKQWLQVPEEEIPAWRTNGIKTLGPFGIEANLKLDLSVEFPEDHKEKKLPGKFIANGPEESIKVYKEALGNVEGALSPVFPVTIKQNDPAAALIRIPPNAASFAFVYPVITGSLEVKIERKSPIDSFLLFGGFVYFDSNMKVIRVNGLWVGNNMQMSGPKPLPKSVADKLKADGRFHDVTLEYLRDQGNARQFAWILPGEFEEADTPHGGWCYLYEDEAVNNFFSVASAKSATGLEKAVSLRDLESS